MKKTSYIFMGLIAFTLLWAIIMPLVAFTKNSDSVAADTNRVYKPGKKIEHPIDGKFSAVSIDFNFVNPRVIIVGDGDTTAVLEMDSGLIETSSVTVENGTLNIDVKLPCDDRTGRYYGFEADADYDILVLHVASDWLNRISTRGPALIKGLHGDSLRVNTYDSFELQDCSFDTIIK